MTESTLTLQEQITQAKAAYEAEEFTQAAAAFKSAQTAYLQANDPLNAAEMANNCSVALLKAGNAQAALDAVLGTPEIFAQANDPRRQAMALGNQASALDDLKKYEEALSIYQQSASIFQQLGERDLHALVLKRISNMQFRNKRRAEAMSTMVDALNAQTRLDLKDRFLLWLLRLVGKLSTPR